MSNFQGALLANTPQLIPSYLCVMINSLFTVMIASNEYMQYAKHRKPLHVTSPAGEQASTYWLEIPFKYAIPLAALSSLLHWTASRAIFMVQMVVLGDNREIDPIHSISIIGYPSNAILLTIIVGTVIVGLRTAAAL